MNKDKFKQVLKDPNGKMPGPDDGRKKLAHNNPSLNLIESSYKNEESK